MKPCARVVITEVSFQGRSVSEHLQTHRKATEVRDELLESYEKYYVEGFRTNDVSLIDEIVRYPIAYIRDGQVEMRDTYPIDPARLKAELGWDHSKNWTYEINGISETNAHMTASATRCRKDGSVIENVHGLYSFCRVGGAWKMYAIAEITF